MNRKLKLVSMISIALIPSIMFGAEAAVPDIGTVFNNISSSLTNIPKMIMGVATIAGLGFAVASIFKFKQHKDAPQQVPLGQPIALLGFGVMLIWLPFLLQSLGTTIATDKAGTTKSGVNEAPEWIKNQ